MFSPEDQPASPESLSGFTTTAQSPSATTEVTTEPTLRGHLPCTTTVSWEIRTAPGPETAQWPTLSADAKCRTRQTLPDASLTQ